MIPLMRDIIQRYSLKGWTLERVLQLDQIFADSPAVRNLIVSPHCMYCGAYIKWAFECSHAPVTSPADPAGIYLKDAPPPIVYVGSECVKSFIDGFNGKESIAFLRAAWKQRRTYFWKRYRNQVVIVGPRKHAPRIWWAAIGEQLLEPNTWQFSQRRFASAEEARTYVTNYVLTEGSR